MDQRTMYKADFITSIVLIAFSISMLVFSLELPRLQHRNINPWTVPGLVPGFISVVVLVLATVLLIRSLINRGHRLGLTGEGIVGFLKGETFFRLALTVALVIIYAVFLVGTVPYWIATFVYIITFILIFELRPAEKPRVGRVLILASVEAVIATAVVAGVFQYLFLVDLP